MHTLDIQYNTAVLVVRMRMRARGVLYSDTPDCVTWILISKYGDYHNEYD